MQEEWAKFWHDRALNNLELLRATYITHVFAPHAHEGFAIGIMERGAQTFIYQGRKRLVMPAGCIAIVNPGEVHIGQAATVSGWTYRMFYPDASVLETAAAELFGSNRGIPFFSSPILFDEALFQMIRGMHAALEDPYTSQLGREVVLLQTVSQLILRHADFRPVLKRRAAENLLMGKVRAYLDEHFAENVSLSELAAYAGLDRSYLVRAFKRVYGLPPHAYQTQIRVEQSKPLLLSGVPLVEVAARAGFVDQSHFSRHFKRIVGIAPGHYRLVL